MLSVTISAPVLTEAKCSKNTYDDVSVLVASNASWHVHVQRYIPTLSFDEEHTIVPLLSLLRAFIFNHTHKVRQRIVVAKNTFTRAALITLKVSLATRTHFVIPTRLANSDSKHHSIHRTMHAPKSWKVS